MSALAAWSGAAHLHIGHTALDVLFEPAEVASLVLPTVPLVGVPLTPFVQTNRCEAHHCRWTWERLLPGADEWEYASSEREYEPKATDHGARLRVRAVPPAGDRGGVTHSLLARVTEADEPVAVAPPRSWQSNYYPGAHSLQQPCGGPWF